MHTWERYQPPTQGLTESNTIQPNMNWAKNWSEPRPANGWAGERNTISFGLCCELDRFLRAKQAHSVGQAGQIYGSHALHFRISCGLYAGSISLYFLRNWLGFGPHFSKKVLLDFRPFCVAAHDHHILRAHHTTQPGHVLRISHTWCVGYVHGSILKV